MSSSRPQIFLASLLLAIFTFGLPATASADDVSWKRGWQKFRTWEYIYTGGALAGAVSVELLWEESAEPNWRGPFLLDNVVRDLMLPSSEEGVLNAGTLSDIGVLTNVFYPFADAIWAAGFVHHDPEVTGQMMLINLESFATNLLVVGIAKRIIGRERPGFGDCYYNPDASDECRRNTRSHPSGHTSTAFTGAGLTCVHHANLPLYGGGGADVAACVAAMSVATFTGLMRISANAHYLSDVLVGAFIGTAAGFIMPSLLHYSGGSSERELETVRQVNAPMLLQWGGQF